MPSTNGYDMKVVVANIMYIVCMFGTIQLREHGLLILSFLPIMLK